MEPTAAILLTVGGGLALGLVVNAVALLIAPWRDEPTDPNEWAP